MSNVPSQCLSWSWHLECMELERKAGYATALDAARKVIEDLRGCLGTDDNGDGTVWVEKIDALDAIDALREKP